MKFKILLLFFIMSCITGVQANLPTLQGLDKYLEKQESAYQDITEGAEKTIIWANTPAHKTEYSIIYLHGFSATRQESAPLTDRLGQELGANVFYTRLTGHGRTDDKLTDSSIEKWRKDVLEAYEIAQLIGEKVIVVSVSTGGTLSTWLAAQENIDKIAAFVMISPNFDVPNQDAYMLDWPLGIGVKLAEWKIGKNHSWEPKNAEQEKYWNTSYPIRSVRTMVKLLKEVKKIDKQTITAPTLMIYSSKDTVILPSAIEENFAKFASSKKQLVQYNDSEDRSNHVLAGYILSPSSVEPVLNIILDYLRKHKVVEGSKLVTTKTKAQEPSLLEKNQNVSRTPAADVTQ